jgi:hypothetical protein
VVHDKEVASYFGRVFEDDWNADGNGAQNEPSNSDPSDYILEAIIVAVVSGIGIWLVAREI